MLMGLLDFFKKYKREYDVTNMRVTDLKTGFVFDYDLSTWEVLDEYEYDWGDNFFSSEYKISDGTKVCYLNVEEDDEVILSISEKVKIRAIDENLPEYIHKNEKAPDSLAFQGVKYFLEKESPGYFRNVGKTDWAEFISWDYEDEKGERIISVEQWGEFEFEASVGKKIKEFEITNILPA